MLISMLCARCSSTAPSGQAPMALTLAARLEAVEPAQRVVQRLHFGQVGHGDTSGGANGTIRNSRRFMGRDGNKPGAAQPALRPGTAMLEQSYRAQPACAYMSRTYFIPTVRGGSTLPGVRYESTATQPCGGPLPAGAGRRRRFTALPSTVAAQPATPEVHSLQVTSDNGLAPGSRLRFTAGRHAPRESQHPHPRRPGDDPAGRDLARRVHRPLCHQRATTASRKATRSAPSCGAATAP